MLLRTRARAALFLLAGLVVPALAAGAQLNGTYTVDPNGSGSRNYRSLRAALGALGAGVSGPVTFDVKPATYAGLLVVTPVPGASSVNTVTFVTKGQAPAIIDAQRGSVGIFLFDGTAWLNFTNFKIQNVTKYGLYLFGFSPGPGVTRCTFTRLEAEAPPGSSSLQNAVRIEYSQQNTFNQCIFRGGGWTHYSQQMRANVFDGCEYDGKGTASWVLAPFNLNDADNVWQNCFVHDCSSSGYGIYMNLSSYGNMMWHNTIVVSTSQAAVWMGSCCAWSRACSWRDNIIVNLGSGSAAKYGETSSKQLDRFDADYNCYYAPNTTRGTVETERGTYRGTLAGWLTYLKQNPGMIQPGGGTAYDQNSVETDPFLVSLKKPYDIHLQSSSPLVDAGTTKYVAGPWISFNPNATVPTDFEGNSRGTLVDIGADEQAVRISGSGSSSPGGTLNLTLDAAGDGGLPYQVGTSLGPGPIPIGKRKLGLTLDDLLVVSVRNLLPMIFQNYTGFLDNQGRGQARIVIPNFPKLKGVRLYTAFLTLKASAPLGIQSISNTFVFTIN